MPQRQQIDPKFAMYLREAGMSWKEIGILLATEAKRRVPFTSEAVAKAVKKYKEGQK